MLSVGKEVRESMHAALTSIESKLEAHKLAYLSDVRASFHDLRDFGQQNFIETEVSASCAFLHDFQTLM